MKMDQTEDLPKKTVPQLKIHILWGRRKRPGDLVQGAKVAPGLDHILAGDILIQDLGVGPVLVDIGAIVVGPGHAVPGIDDTQEAEAEAALILQDTHIVHSIVHDILHIMEGMTSTVMALEKDAGITITIVAMIDRQFHVVVDILETGTIPSQADVLVSLALVFIHKKEICETFLENMDLLRMFK